MTRATELTVTVVTETVRMTAPYACAALGGIWSEKSGVVNIALEGTLLASAFAAVACQLATGSALAGLVAAVLVGAGVGATHAAFVRRGVDAVVSGIAINLAALGGTRVLLRALYGSSSNSPSLTSGGLPSGAISSLAKLASAVLNPFTLLTLGAAALTATLLSGTRFGIRLRAAGTNPSAAASLGLDVGTIRSIAVGAGGGICGVGGAALVSTAHQFQSGMSGGRGFIALAAVIVSGWRPGRAVLACTVFALLDASQIVVQGNARASHDLVTALPYVATLLSLALLGRRRNVISPDRKLYGE